MAVETKAVVVNCAGLCVKIGTQVVLQDAEFTIHEGERVGVADLAEAAQAQPAHVGLGVGRARSQQRPYLLRELWQMELAVFLCRAGGFRFAAPTLHELISLCLFS